MSQQQQQQQAKQQQPRDGPATTFEADPKVTDIFLGQDGDYFGFVLVAGWPELAASIEKPYQQFLEHVKECFDPQDLVSTNNSLPPAVYLYPSIHLHVTVATFAPAEKKVDDNNPPIIDYTEFEKTHQSLVEDASKLPNWPHDTPIQLRLKSTQLGSKAGILLWDDTSGSVEKMRKCLQQAAAQRNLPIWGIPRISHSTFLRFSQVPGTPGHVVQERYQSKVVPNVHKCFDKTIEATTTKLVCESTPYMHIPDDDKHVFLTLQLGKKGE